MSLYYLLFCEALSVVTAVTTEQPLPLVCPGERVSFNCSLEQPRGSIKWKLWCQCSAELCRDTCTAMPSTVVNSRDTFQHGNVCPSAEYTPAITYEHNFTSVRDMNDTLVSSAVLSINVPLEFQQQSNTRMCLECNDQPPYGYLEILGLPSPPRNFSYHPDYAFTTDTEIVVNFMWSPPFKSSDDGIQYLFSIYGSTNTSNLTTLEAALEVDLKFNKTYYIAIYTVLCNGTLTSEPFMTNITIEQDPPCHPPPAPPGVNITIIMAGSLLSFQCEEGLVPEERLEAQCGLEGRWIPDPTLHTCTNTTSPSTTSVTSTEVLFISGIVSGLLSLLLVCVLGCFIVMARRHCTRKDSQRSGSAIITTRTTTTTAVPLAPEFSSEGVYNVLSYKEKKPKTLGSRDSSQQQEKTANSQRQNYSMINSKYLQTKIAYPNEEYSEIARHSAAVHPNSQYSQIGSTKHPCTVEYSLITADDESVEYCEIGSMANNTRQDSSHTVMELHEVDLTAVYSQVNKISSKVSSSQDEETLVMKLGVLDLDKLVGILCKRSDLWRDLATAVRIPEEQVEMISNHCQSDLDSLVEVCDIWLNKLNAEVALTWQEVIAVLNTIGAQELAEELKSDQIALTTSKKEHTEADIIVEDSDMKRNYEENKNLPPIIEQN